MDILKRALAPVSDQAWQEIEAQARNVIVSNLTARKLVDVEGPKGISLGAVSLGNLKVPKDQKKNQVQYGVHQVLPLVETRISFRLNIWELDDIARGSQDVDLSALEDAAKKIALFEEKAIYNGFPAANIAGLKKACSNKKLACPQNADEALSMIPTGLSVLKQSAINGPYVLLINPSTWEAIVGSYNRGYPLKKQLEEMVEGEIVLCPSIGGMLLASKRGGDFRLTLGLDFSIGYESHDNREVGLFLAESFTFQVFESAALVFCQ